jgi:hypothetical protein
MRHLEGQPMSTPPAYPAPMDPFTVERIADGYTVARRQRAVRSLDDERPGVIARARVAVGRGLVSLGGMVAGHQV